MLKGELCFASGPYINASRSHLLKLSDSKFCNLKQLTDIIASIYSRGVGEFLKKRNRKGDGTRMSYLSLTVHLCLGCRQKC